MNFATASLEFSHLRDSRQALFATSGRFLTSPFFGRVLFEAFRTLAAEIGTRNWSIPW